MINRKFIAAAAFLAVIFVFFATDSLAQKKPLTKNAAEKPLPNLVLNTIEGTEWSLEGERGSIVLLNFWATWCAPCRSEIPILIRLSDKYKAEGVRIVGVSVDSENVAQIEKFIADYKIHYTNVLAKPGSLLSQQKAIPMSLLIDENGVLTKKYIGALEEAIFKKDIEVLLKKKASKQKNQSPQEIKNKRGK